MKGKLEDVIPEARLTAKESTSFGSTLDFVGVLCAAFTFSSTRFALLELLGRGLFLATRSVRRLTAVKEREKA